MPHGSRESPIVKWIQSARKCIFPSLTSIDSHYSGQCRSNTGERRISEYVSDTRLAPRDADKNPKLPQLQRPLASCPGEPPVLPLGLSSNSLSLCWNIKSSPYSAITSAVIPCLLPIEFTLMMTSAMILCLLPI